MQIKMNWFIFTVYIFEKSIFLICFILLFVVIFVSPKENTFKYILDNNIFVFLNRISFAFMCTLDVAVYVFYSMYDLQIYFNFQNVFFLRSYLALCR